MPPIRKPRKAYPTTLADMAEQAKKLKPTGQSTPATPLVIGPRERFPEGLTPSYGERVREKNARFFDGTDVHGNRPKAAARYRTPEALAGDITLTVPQAPKGPAPPRRPRREALGPKPPVPDTESYAYDFRKRK